MGRTRIDQLDDHQRARLAEWAEKWSEIGLRTGPADRERFEAAMRECYRVAKCPWPGVVVWVPSPLVLALAAFVATRAIGDIGTARRRRRLDRKVATLRQRLRRQPPELSMSSLALRRRELVHAVSLRGAERLAEIADDESLTSRDEQLAGLEKRIVELEERIAELDNPSEPRIRHIVRDAVVCALVGKGGATANRLRRRFLADDIWRAVGWKREGSARGVVAAHVCHEVQLTVGDATLGVFDGVASNVRDAAAFSLLRDAMKSAVQTAAAEAVGDLADARSAVEASFAPTRRIDGDDTTMVVDLVRTVSTSRASGAHSGWPPHMSNWFDFSRRTELAHCAGTSFLREVAHLDLPGDLWDRARAYEQIMESAGPFVIHRRFIMVCEHPVAIHREDDLPANPWRQSPRLHATDGPAVVWPDGWGTYFIRGVSVPAKLFEAPEKITVREIVNERNDEIRRVMIDRYGVERFAADAPNRITVDEIVNEWNVEVRRVMLDAYGVERFVVALGAKRVQADDFGELFRVDLPGDEPIVMVRVQNATREPDGSYKTYMLRVPPHCTSAHEAVAWTFGRERSGDYNPGTET